MPQNAPSRAALPGRGWSATRVVTAARWSGSIAWRSPTRKPSPQLTISGVTGPTLTPGASRRSQKPRLARAPALQLRREQRHVLALLRRELLVDLPLDGSRRAL